MNLVEFPPIVVLYMRMDVHSKLYRKSIISLGDDSIFLLLSLELTVAMKCYRDEQEIYREIWHRANQTCTEKNGPFPGRTWCRGVYDGWNCWNHTPAGTFAYADCSVISQFDEVDEAIATKFCTPQGHWWRNSKGVEWANYTMCFTENTRHQFALLLHVIFIVGYVISIALCTAAFLIFSLLRQLKCYKNRIHQNLFVSFILNSLCQIVWLHVQSSESILQLNSLWCRFLHVWSIFFLISNYAWMFSEGAYLQFIVQFPFVAESKVYLAATIVGWGVPILPVLVYVILRSICVRSPGQLKYCWTTMISEFWWCYASVSLAFQIANCIFLINIVRIVLSKTLHSAHVNQDISSAKQFWTTAKALIILMPLFGVQYILSCFYRPLDPKSTFTTIFQVVYVPLTSLQGAIVAIVVCFLNNEVVNQVKRHWCTFKQAYFHTTNGTTSRAFYSSVACHNNTMTTVPNPRRSSNFTGGRRSAPTLLFHRPSLENLMTKTMILENRRTVNKKRPEIVNGVTRL